MLCVQYARQESVLEQDVDKLERGGDQAFKEKLRHMRDETDAKAQGATEAAANAEAREADRSKA